MTVPEGLEMVWEGGKVWEAVRAMDMEPEIGGDEPDKLAHQVKR